MIKPILIGLACFLLALAASTSLTVLRTPVTTAARDTTVVADTTQHTSETQAANGSQFPVAGEFSADAPAFAPDPIQLAEAVPHQADPVPAGTKHTDPNTEPQDFARVGKILMNMKPVDAAAILKYLGDVQVEGVLRSLGPRQAAVILTALPTERAAQLSKRLLVVPAEEKKP